MDEMLINLKRDYIKVGNTEKSVDVPRVEVVYSNFSQNWIIEGS